MHIILEICTVIFYLLLTMLAGMSFAQFNEHFLCQDSTHLKRDYICDRTHNDCGNKEDERWCDSVTREFRGKFDTIIVGRDLYYRIVDPRECLGSFEDNHCRQAYLDRKPCQKCVTDFNRIADGKSDMIFGIDESEDIKLIKGNHYKHEEIKHVLFSGFWMCLRAGGPASPEDCVTASGSNPFLMTMPPMPGTHWPDCELTNAMELFYYCRDKDLCIRKEWPYNCNADSRCGPDYWLCGKRCIPKTSPCGNLCSPDRDHYFCNNDHHRRGGGGGGGGSCIGLDESCGSDVNCPSGTVRCKGRGNRHQESTHALCKPATVWKSCPGTNKCTLRQRGQCRNQRCLKENFWYCKALFQQDQQHQQQQQPQQDSCISKFRPCNGECPPDLTMCRSNGTADSFCSTKQDCQEDLNKKNGRIIRPKPIPTTATSPMICPVGQSSCQSPDCVQLDMQRPCYQWCIPEGGSCSFQATRPTAIIPSSSSPCEQQDSSDQGGPRMCGVTPSTIIGEEDDGSNAGSVTGEDGNGSHYYWMVAFIVLAAAAGLTATAFGVAAVARKRQSITRRAGSDRPLRAQYRVTIERIQPESDESNFPVYDRFESYEEAAGAAAKGEGDLEKLGGGYEEEIQRNNVYYACDGTEEGKHNNYAIECSSRNVYYE